MSDKTTYIMTDPQGSNSGQLLEMAALSGGNGFGGNGAWNNPFAQLLIMLLLFKIGTQADLKPCELLEHLKFKDDQQPSYILEGSETIESIIKEISKRVEQDSSEFEAQGL